MRRSKNLTAPFSHYSLSLYSGWHDPWWHEPPSRATAQYTIVAKSKVFKIAPTWQVQSEAMLQSTPIVPLSLQQASTLTSANLQLSNGEQAYLIRSLDPANGAGELSVGYRGQQLFADVQYTGGEEYVTHVPLIVL